MRIHPSLPEFQLDEESKITFNYTNSDNKKTVNVSVDGDTPLEDILKTFEQFLNAIGYCIPGTAGVAIVDFDGGDDDDEEEAEDS